MWGDGRAYIKAKLLTTGSQDFAWVALRLFYGLVSNHALLIFSQNAQYNLQKDRRRHAKAVCKGADLADIQLALAVQNFRDDPL